MSDDKARLKQVVAQARERFKLCVDAEAENRREALNDLRFLDGDQWGDGPKAERLRDGRPAMVVNRMDQFVQHITNAQRMQQIAARVFPVDDKADPETAEIIQGMLRHIEYRSDADMVYGTAAFYAVAIGFGGWHVVTDYCDPLSFDMEIKLERVRNPFQMYFDPYHQHPSGKDAGYSFLTTQYSEDEYRRAFPNSDLAKLENWDTTIGDSCGDWIEAKSVRVAEYYVIEYTEDTLVKLADGRSKLQKELSQGDMPLLGSDGKVVSRPTSIPVVKHYQLNGYEVLGETAWPTSPGYASTPLVKVVGNELDIEGKVKLKGIIRNLKDAQRQYNFMLSAQTEAIDADKGPVMVAEGQAEGHEGELANINKRKVVQYKPAELNGKLLPPPGRLQSNASIAAMTEARLMAADDLKALTGIYDAALGAQSNETSGVAIRGRQAQSDTANYHFTGNLVRSINHSARLVLGAIPTIYDTPRTMRIIGADDAQDVVRINEMFQPEGAKEPVQYNVGVGTYDVVMQAGPSAATKREQDAALLTGLVKVSPGLMQVAPDLILKAVGAPPELVERSRKALPPEFRAPEGNEPQIPPEVQQQLAQSEAALNDAMAQLDEYKSKKFEIESRERIEAAKIALEEKRLQLDIAKHQASLNSQEAQTLLKSEIDVIKTGQQLDAQAAAQEAGAAAEAM